MEYLNRGTIAIKVENGVFISWRLLGTDNYNTSFSIYRNDKKIKTIKNSTNYLDKKGTINDKYTIVPAIKNLKEKKISVPVLNNQYIEILLDIPNNGISKEKRLLDHRNRYEWRRLPKGRL